MDAKVEIIFKIQNKFFIDNDKLKLLPKKLPENLRNQKVSYKFVTERLPNKFFSMRRDVFQAIADPTRREIINLVAKNSLNLNALTENFNISRPAISKHIKILTECGLIIVNQQGRERYCEANLQSLGEVSQWIEQYRTFWTSKLDALENFLDKKPKTAIKPATGKAVIKSITKKNKK